MFSLLNENEIPYIIIGRNKLYEFEKCSKIITYLELKESLKNNK